MYMFQCEALHSHQDIINAEDLFSVNTSVLAHVLLDHDHTVDLIGQSGFR